MKVFKIIFVVTVFFLSIFPVSAINCINPAPEWKFDWEYQGLNRFYQLKDLDGDGRFETAYLKFQNTTKKTLRFIPLESPVFNKSVRQRKVSKVYNQAGRNH